jgi:hypothetical protein
MKLTARALVAILVLTGAAASTLTSSASTTSSSQSKVTATRTSMLPVPTCDPSDPNACGMGQR